MQPDRDWVHLWDMLNAAQGELHPAIPWRPIVDQRNVLIHAYDEIEDERVWRLAAQDIPRLIEQLKELLPPENS
jgi:uncharacterized protein with HEPN domain